MFVYVCVYTYISLCNELIEETARHRNVIITQQNVKIDKFGDFSCDIDYNGRTDIFRDVTDIFRLADTKCPPAAQRKQAKRACLTNSTRDMQGMCWCQYSFKHSGREN